MLRIAVLCLTFAASMLDAAAQTAPAPRPRVGLVLSGGGARGLSHVGVLKVLEAERIPIDAIAGTSMGAIVGGLYASGMSAAELERELLLVRWDTVFSPRVDRQHLSQRRKEEDFEISPLLELGLRDGELRAPIGAVSSRGLETLLRRYTLPVRAVRAFDQLPIPFRAVATDLETGAAVVLDRGDLALALRSSMSVPGVFPPTELDGRILGDGGLVNNVPIDVARAMGVDAVIVVNIGTPLAGRETLNSAVGIATQTINILTEQNVQRSLALLDPRDVLVSPQLGKLTAGDFEKVAEAFAIGERGAKAALERLQAYAVPPEAYAQWRAEHPKLRRPEAKIGFITFEGTTSTNPSRFAAQLESQAGQPFDAQRAERDARTLAASGDYLRADYRLVSSDEGGDGLVFDLDDKPWGPNYLRIGLDLSTDFNGRGSFNLKLSHNRHWLTQNGTEWRNRLQIGAVPSVFTEIYHPLNWTIGLANDWFVAGYASSERRDGTLYSDSGSELARYKRTTARAGIDLGQPWGRFGELRIGLSTQRVRATPTLIAASLGTAPSRLQASETGLRLAVVIDQLDFANFPQRGYRLVGEAALGDTGDAGRFQRLEASAMAVKTFGRHTFNFFTSARGASRQESAALGRYELGGFQQLSGYRDGQLLGNYVLFSRMTWYMRLAETPTISRAFFIGASAEAGNAYATREALHAHSLRTGMSLFFGADTGLGPLYLGLTHAPRGQTGVVLFIGRP
ncbi:MAG: patatin-like phospholipase family protein [Burkholderiaceae bacterium]|nr:patatin-like phospholipase family protein [Burkholderiaceae bacterium]